MATGGADSDDGANVLTDAVDDAAGNLCGAAAGATTAAGWRSSFYDESPGDGLPRP